MKKNISERRICFRGLLLGIKKQATNKKGSVSVFLTAILVTMIMTSMVFVHAAREMTQTGYRDAVLTLAGRSVLAEFDSRLQKEYGLFAFYGMSDLAERRIRQYAGHSFETDNVQVSLAGYSMADAAVFEKQVEEYMNYMMAEKGISYIRRMWEKKERAEKQEEEHEERVLKNKVEINSLPSKGVQGGIDILGVMEKGLPSMEEILDESAATFRVNEYILSNFKYRVEGEKDRKTFFENEVEYILHGKFSDEANKNACRRNLLLLRAPLNAAHIYSCSQKRSATMILAQSITPGPEASITQALIVSAWAAWEAENDVRLLERGKNAALIKTESTWATTLKAAWEGEYQSGVIHPASEKGMSYMEYLRIFLYLEKREARLLRTMDLIQLNLRGSYDRDFLMKNCNAGFHMDVLAGGKTYAYEQTY